MKCHIEKPGIFCCYTTAETSTAFRCVSTSSQLGQAMLLELLCQCLSEQTATANTSTPKRLDIQKHPNIAIFWKELHFPKLVGITVSMFNDNVNGLTTPCPQRIEFSFLGMPEPNSFENAHAMHLHQRDATSLFCPSHQQPCLGECRQVNRAF